MVESVRLNLEKQMNQFSMKLNKMDIISKGNHFIDLTEKVQLIKDQIESYDKKSINLQSEIL